MTGRSASRLVLDSKEAVKLGLSLRHARSPEINLLILTNPATQETTTEHVRSAIMQDVNSYQRDGMCVIDGRWKTEILNRYNK